MHFWSMFPVFDQKQNPSTWCWNTAPKWSHDTLHAHVCAPPPFLCCGIHHISRSSRHILGSCNVSPLPGKIDRLIVNLWIKPLVHLVFIHIFTPWMKKQYAYIFHINYCMVLTAMTDHQVHRGSKQFEITYTWFYVMWHRILHNNEGLLHVTSK